MPGEALVLEDLSTENPTRPRWGCVSRTGHGVRVESQPPGRGESPRWQGFCSDLSGSASKGQPGFGDRKG